MIERLQYTSEQSYSTRFGHDQELCPLIKKTNWEVHILFIFS